MATTFYLEGNTAPLQLENPPSSEVIKKKSLFLLLEGRYYPVSRIQADAEHATVTFAGEALEAKPSGDHVVILLPRRR
jgi:hypothetical protein